MVIDDGARVRCSKLIFRTYARNQGGLRRRGGKEKGKRWRKRGQKEKKRKREGRKRKRVAVEQKLKCLHPWQNQQPVDASLAAITTAIR